MKKVLLSVAVIAAFSFASCKKDRVCTCVDSGTSTIKTYTKSTKKAAKANCLSGTYTYGTYAGTRTCTLN